MTAAAMDRQFAALEENLPDNDATRAARTEALARFEALGFPGRSIESWHYTDLGMLARKDFRYVPPAPEAGSLSRVEDWIAKSGIAPDAPRYVFVDGRYVSSLSRQPAASGITLELLADNPDLLADKLDVNTGSALASLNTAFAADGIAIRVKDKIAEPIHLVFVGCHDGLAPQIRLTIELAAAARAAVVEHFADLHEGGESWLNLVTGIRLEEGATLELYRLQTHGPEHLHTSLTRAELARDARLIAGNLEAGGKLIRNELELLLAGERAEAELVGIAFGNDKQHIDTRWAVDHRAPLSNSRQDYRAIVADSSRSVFNGKVTVRQDAQQIDAKQRNDNLLLSPRAEANTKPELEIYADQVACSHGATVGELSEEHLFYLRSRGIEEDVARAILTAAFAEKIVRQFGPEWVRQRAAAILEVHLPIITANREAAA